MTEDSLRTLVQLASGGQTSLRLYSDISDLAQTLQAVLCALGRLLDQLDDLLEPALCQPGLINSYKCRRCRTRVTRHRPRIHR
jgi:hypothetical protein